jgi:hypothetical protein
MTARPDPDLFAERDVFGLPPLAGAVPDAVLIGLSGLASSAPLWGGEAEWLELVDRVRVWTCRWYGPASAAGWSVVELYGLSADAPQARREMMGGVWLANLRGRQTIAIDRDAVRLVARTAAHLSVYRPAAGGVLAWSLRPRAI